MKAIIAQYYKTKAKAVERINELKRLYKGRTAFYAVESNNGYFVIDEKQARKCFPDLEFSYKDRKYNKKL